MGNVERSIVFVPFLGDFLSIGMYRDIIGNRSEEVFVPFLGDFLSMARKVGTLWKAKQFSSPFLGTFFQ